MKKLILSLILCLFLISLVSADYTDYDNFNGALDFSKWHYSSNNIGTITTNGGLLRVNTTTYDGGTWKEVISNWTFSQFNILKIRVVNNTGTGAGGNVIALVNGSVWSYDNPQNIILKNRNGVCKIGGTTTSPQCTGNFTIRKLTDSLISVENESGAYLNVTISGNLSLMNLSLLSNWANPSTFHIDYVLYLEPEINVTYNASTYETSIEFFGVNTSITLTSANLIYGGVSYSASVSGNNSWIYVPINTTIGNRSFYWSYNGGIYRGQTYYQYTNPITFGLCNSTNNKTFVNYTFKDEVTGTNINASLASSTFYYWLGNQSLNKSLSFSNSSENADYAFCFSPASNNLYVNPYLQYSSTNYPQRIYNPSGSYYYSNQTTNISLYLLSSTDGGYVNFQTATSSGAALSGVHVNVTRVIDGSSTIIGNSITDDSGIASLFLDPDFSYTLVFTKLGYQDYTLVIYPTQSTYTIVMTSLAPSSGVVDYSQGNNILIIPSDDHLEMSGYYNFSFAITSIWDLDSFGMKLYDNYDNLLDSNSSVSSSGGTLSLANISTSNYSGIYMDYYYVINSSYFNGTRFWVVQNTTGNGYSILNIFTDLNTYMSIGLFGIDDFGKAVLTFLILVLMIGTLTYRYGIQNEAALMGLAFGAILFLDIGVGIIPNPSIAGLTPKAHLITIVAGIIMLGMIIKEELR